jgi:hypothetical protein
MKVVGSAMYYAWKEPRDAYKLFGRQNFTERNPGRAWCSGRRILKWIS